MQTLLQADDVGPFPQLTGMRFALFWPLFIVDVVLLVFLCMCFAFGCCARLEKREEASHPIWNNLFIDPTLHMIRIQYLNARKISYKSLPPPIVILSVSSSLHRRVLVFFHRGPGTSNWVDYQQIFILSIFSSSHRSVVGNL